MASRGGGWGVLGRQVPSDVTRRFPFCRKFSHLPWFASFLNVIGASGKRVQPLTGERSRNMSGRSGMRVSKCLPEAGVWRRGVGGAAASEIDGFNPLTAQREALQICRYPQRCAGARAQSSRIRAQFPHRDPTLVKTLGTLSGEFHGLPVGRLDVCSIC